MCLDKTDVAVTVADHGLWAEPATSELQHDISGQSARRGREASASPSLPLLVAARECSSRD